MPRPFAGPVAGMVRFFSPGPPELEVAVEVVGVRQGERRLGTGDLHEAHAQAGGFEGEDAVRGRTAFELGHRGDVGGDFYGELLSGLGPEPMTRMALSKSRRLPRCGSSRRSARAR